MHNRTRKTGFRRGLGHGRIFGIPALICALAFAAALLCLSCGSTSGYRAAASVDPDYPRSHAQAAGCAEAAVKRLMRRHHIPGVAVALVHDQEVLLLDAYGKADRERDIDATKDTIYTMYSIAKPFTAIEIMRLHEEGLLDLDVPVTDILPDFQIRGTFGELEPITARQLLSHRSGLPRNSNYRGTLREAGWRTLALQVQSLPDAYLAYPPGTRYKYSNLGYNVLGHIIETLREEDFVGYMDRELLAAIGMNASSFLSTRVPEGAEKAAGYEYSRGAYVRHEMHDHTQIASGNLFSSAADMAEFIRFVLRGGSAAGRSVIGTDQLAQMFTPQFATADDPQRNGLGWMTSREAMSELMVWHQGGDVDSNALVALLPESGHGIALLTNCGSFEGAVLLQAAMDILRAAGAPGGGAFREAAANRQAPRPDGRAVSSAPAREASEALDRYSGLYVVFGQPVRIQRRGRRLKAPFGPITLSLNPVGNGEFAPSHWLLGLGLGALLPADPSLLRFRFPTAGAGTQRRLTVHISDIHYELCDSYPCPERSCEEAWSRIAGSYEGCRVTVEDEVLVMSGVGVLKASGDDAFTVVGGPYEGETVLFDPDRGSLTHQGITYHRTLR